MLAHSIAFSMLPLFDLGALVSHAIAFDRMTPSRSSAIDDSPPSRAFATASLPPSH